MTTSPIDVPTVKHAGQPNPLPRHTPGTPINVPVQRSPGRIFPNPLVTPPAKEV